MIAKALAHEPSILFLDEPTAGVDVELRRDMWRIVRTLRDAGVTIILTTHYIEEAEELADRIGVINKGALILVEEKDVLMHKLGKKQLILTLREPVEAVPDSLAEYGLQLSPNKRELTYIYDAQNESTGVKPLFQALDATGLAYKDVQTKVSSLEEIFVDIVRAGS
jgi:ABC-2 type transport system ATP-binding protein